MESLFRGLPFGFSDFSEIKNSLLECGALKRLPENTQTVISVLFPYYLGEEFYEKSNISRYAVSEDYHIITGKILNEIAQGLKEMFPENQFESFVDNSPFPEVRCAVNAGLGVMGVNNLFINRDYGSWVFLGEIATDKHFPAFKGEYSLCSGCNKCIDACPMGALTGKGVIKEKCLSFLSQKKGELSEEIRAKIAETGCIWGCDICQKACPMNVNAKITPIKEFFDTAKPILTKDDDIENRAFAWRGKKVVDRNVAIIQQG